MLAHEDGPPAVPTPPSGVLGVEFTLEGLLDFRDAADGIQFGKTAEEARPVPRKRPNYNGSNRKFLAKIHDRQKLLDWMVLDAHIFPPTLMFLAIRVLLLPFGCSMLGSVATLSSAMSSRLFHASCNQGLANMVPADPDFTGCQGRNADVTEELVSRECVK